MTRTVSVAADRRAEIQRLEQALANRDHRGVPLESLLAAEFVEFGSSGRLQARDGVVAWLTGPPAAPPEAPYTLVDFSDRDLAPGVVLVTYKAERRGSDGSMRSSLRSSIWSWRENRWQMVFHQGTPL